MPAVGLAAAGGDRGHVRVFGEKFFDPGQCGRRPGQGIEPEFKEFRILERRAGALLHLRQRGGLDGDAQLAMAQPRPFNPGKRHGMCNMGHSFDSGMVTAAS